VGTGTSNFIKEIPIHNMGKDPQRHKIAVSGANGFIGSHCVIALLEADFDVVAVGK